MSAIEKAGDIFTDLTERLEKVEKRNPLKVMTDSQSSRMDTSDSQTGADGLSFDDKLDALHEVIN